MTMLAGAPGPVAAPPFGEPEAWHWFKSFGSLAHETNLFDLYAIEHADGDVVLSPSAAMAVGIYVVVDLDDCIRYIGKVRRRGIEGIQERFADHHAAATSWAGAWLLPLRDDCPDRTVLDLEEQMIAAFRPDGNLQHVPADRSRSAQ